MITLVLYIGSWPNFATWFPCGRGRTIFILGSLDQRSRSPLLLIEFLTTGSFPHDNFSSVYWIFTKLGHRGRTLFILGSLPLYRLIIYIDGRILWCTHFLFCIYLSQVSRNRFHGKYSNTLFFVIHMFIVWLMFPRCAFRTSKQMGEKYGKGK